MCNGEEGDAHVLGRLEHASLHIYTHRTGAFIQEGKLGSVGGGERRGGEGEEERGEEGGGTFLMNSVTPLKGGSAMLGCKRYDHTHSKVI